MSTLRYSALLLAEKVSSVSGLDYWGDGKPLYVPEKLTGGLDYWGDGQPLGIIISAEAAAAEQELTPSGIVSSEAFGTHEVGLALAPTGISSAEAFGTQRLVQALAPTSITSAEDFGSPDLILELLLAPAGVASAESFGTAKVNQFLLPANIGSEETFGSTLVAPNQTISLITNYYYDIVNAVYIDVIATQQIEPARTTLAQVRAALEYVSGDWAASARWNLDRAIESPTYHGVVFYSNMARGYLYDDEIFAPVWGGWDDGGIRSARKVGNPLALPGTLRLFVPISILGPDSFPGIDFGVPQLNPGPVDVLPVAAESGESFGVAQLNMTVLPAGIVSQEATDTPTINQVLHPVAIASAEDVSSGAELLTGPVDVLPVGIPSGEDAGEPVLGRALRSIGIESAEAVGQPVLTLIVKPISIPGASQVGAANVVHLVKPSAIPSVAQAGTPQVIYLVRPNSIASLESVGAPEAIPGPVWIYPPGIESREVIGWEWVKPPREPANLIVLGASSLPVLQFVSGQETIDLYDSPIRMVVNG